MNNLMQDEFGSFILCTSVAHNIIPPTQEKAVQFLFSLYLRLDVDELEMRTCSGSFSSEMMGTSISTNVYAVVVPFC